MMRMTDKKTVLECKDLVAGYQTKAGFVGAVDNVNFTLKKGELLGIAGESGCGKSTLAYAVMKLMRDNAMIRSGEINFQGRDIAHLSDEEMKKIRWVDMSMVFQSAMNALNPVLTIGEK